MLLRYARVSVTLLAATIIAAATMIVAPAPADAASFPDTAGTSFERPVDALVSAGVIQGCDDGSRFCPARPLSRSQLASMLARALDLPATDQQPFGDVAGNTHEANINALAAAGITDGCADGRFCPQERITRAEMATMLSRAFEVATTGKEFFTDVGGTHAGSINNLAEAGIAAGCGRPEGTYCPQESLQRQQAAIFVARAMNFTDRVSVSTVAERNAARAASSRDKIWNDLAQCESGGNWSINTGNGYYGGLQFALQSWRAVGGSGYPHNHSREEQIRRAELLLDRQGWGAWPACSSKLGYR